MPEKHIATEFRERQSQLIYYVIALCVACIGFSVYNTLGRALSWPLLPLGFAVLAWGVSIYCGITFLGYVISNLFAEFDYYKVIKGTHPITGNHPEAIKVGVKAMAEATQKNADKASIYFIWQMRCFYLGMFLFIVWHVLEMYLKAYPLPEGK